MRVRSFVPNGAPLRYWTANAARRLSAAGNCLLECGLVSDDTDHFVINFDAFHRRLNVDLPERGSSEFVDAQTMAESASDHSIARLVASAQDGALYALALDK